MKKITFLICLLMAAIQSYSQLPATLTDYPLPTVAGPVGQPQNASSSTLQDITFMGASNNFYMLSWDVSSPLAGSPCGIAWRRTDASGTLINQGYKALSNCFDIDVVLFQKNVDSIYALVAFYYLGGAATPGYYYNLYRYSSTGLTTVSTMNLLMTTPTYAGINVDGNSNNKSIAITWSIAGSGLYVKAAPANTIAFGPNVLLPGTSGFSYPDICIGQYPGNRFLEIASRSTSNTQVRVQRLDLDVAIGGSASGLVTEYINTTSAFFGVPRIDCPDQYSNQKWVMVYMENTGAFERIHAAVKNTIWSAGTTDVLVHSDVSTSYPDNRPVVAYNDNTDMIHVGWITQNALPGYAYVAQLVNDPGSVVPNVIPGSYMMISGVAAGSTPVLAFSGQNTMSAFSGLHTVYSQYNTFFASQYCMTYKNKAWSYPYFRMGNDITPDIATVVFPNPFTDQLSLKLPLKGNYDISIIGIDGKIVYVQNAAYEAMQQTNINTSQFGPGIYFLHISCAEHQLDETRKLVK